MPKQHAERCTHDDGQREHLPPFAHVEQRDGDRGQNAQAV